MAKQFGSQVDLQQIPVLNLVPYKSGTAPSTPVTGQLWWDSTNGQLKVCTNATGPVWTQCDNVTGGTASNVTDGDKGDITIASGVWTIDTGVVTSAKILDGTVALGDLAFTPITTATTATGDLTGTYPALTVANNAITSAKIADGTIVITDTGTSFTLDSLATTRPAIAAVNLNSNRIFSLADPSGAQDAATKNYVDNVAQGIDAKFSCKAATTANITLTGTQTVDTVALVANDRCLVKNQTSVPTNGIYSVQSGAWTRVTDMDAWTEVPGAFTFVEQGTQADTGWVCTADQGGTLGTTNITWTQFSGAGNYSANNGLTLTGTVFDVAPSATGGLQASPGSLAIKYIAGAGVLTNANGLTLALTPSGGILVDTSGVYVDRTRVPFRYPVNVGTLNAGVETTVPHTLNTTDVIAQFKLSGRDIELDWRVIDANNIGVTADVGYAANAVRAMIVG
jgi:hypothetical protein